MAAATAHGVPITTLIFDIDDTLYPVSSGFSEHRNGPVVAAFMVAKLGFATPQEALEVRNEYFKRYHSTMKGLGIASDEGRLPQPFTKEELIDYWSEHCEFERYLRPVPSFIEALHRLRSETSLKIVAFSNSPRKYCLRCLDALGVREFFHDDHVFGVDDVLPACKPEPAAFAKVLQSLGVNPTEAVMFEDSMKNIRAAKDVGLHTVLIDETLGGQLTAVGGEAALLGDGPERQDPAIDSALPSIGGFLERHPELLAARFVRTVDRS